MANKISHAPSRPNAQAKYRDKRSNNGFVRFELQVKKDTKELFEAMASTAANEIAEPWDRRRRLAAARAQLLDELLDGISHDFYTLKEQIHALKAEISTLTPSFMASHANDVPIPAAIQALPNDPHKLKQLLSNCYHHQQNMNVKIRERQRIAEQYQALYEASTEENDRLKSS